MNKDKLVLKDGTEIELETGASLSTLGVLSADKAAMVVAWDKLTPDNLAEVQIKNGDGLVVGTYTDLILVSETSTVNADGTVLTCFRLREKSDVEERLDAVESGLSTHTGAIDDLGAITSALADAQEGA